MSRLSILAPFLVFLLLPRPPDAQSALLYDNGAPDLRSGFEITHWIEADRFTLTVPAFVKNIQFWDLEIVGYFQTSILWEIHADSDGIPGALLFGGTSMNLTHVATGRNDGFGFTEFVSTFDITPAALTEGIYWLVLHNGPLSNNSIPNVYWETTAGSSTIPSRTVIAPFTGPWDSNGPSSKLAFKLNGVSGPTITAIDYDAGTARVSFTTINGQRYAVHYKNELADTSWTLVPGAENVFGTGAVVPITDSSLGGRTRRFFHVTLLP